MDIMTREEKNKIHNDPTLWLKDGQEPVSIESLKEHEINKALEFCYALRKKMKLSIDCQVFKLERLNAKIHTLKSEKLK